MIPIGSIKMEGVIGNHRTLIEKILKDAKTALDIVKRDFGSSFIQEEKNYLDKVIACFEEKGFLTYNQEQISKKAEDLGKVPDNDKAKISLSSHILRALNYKHLRRTFYPKFFRELGLRACVYCNSQPTLAIQKFSPNESSVTIQGKFQLDHYRNKDEYPFLSICFYNLYPVCSCCNNAKSKSSVDFDLYGDQPAKPYTFKLSPGSLARYLATGNAETIKILFLDPDKDNLQDPSLKSFQEVFNIQGIYETQTDLVEELILKSQIYTGSYKKALTTSFKKLLSNEKLANRMLIGNYMDLEDIHKRPMAKFIQDITIQLKMI